MELSTHRTAERDHAVALLAVQDEDVASPSSVRLLITGATQQGVETLARRVHETGPRARFPFVHRCAGDLPVGAEMLTEYWASFRVAAAVGSVLISAVDEMLPVVQDALSELLATLELARKPAAAVRVISGTTVWLVDRVVAGMFSKRLFYQLNTIHLMAGDDPLEVAPG